MLDTSSTSSFMKKTIKFSGGLLERIKHNSKYLEFNKGKELEHEEKRLLKTLRKHRAAIGYTLDDLKGISPTLCQHKIIMEPDANPVVDDQHPMSPNMKDVMRMKY